MDSLWKWIEKVIKTVLTRAFNFFHKELKENQIHAFMQFVKFGIVGLSNTVICYVIYLVCLLLFHKIGVPGTVDYIIAQAIGFTVSVLWSFYWNNRFVFTLKKGEHRSKWQALLKTFISYSFTGLFLNSILLLLWIQFLQISEFIAPILNLLISVPLNFIINKFWAFQSKKSE